MMTLVSLIWGGSFILMKRATLAYGPISIGAGRVFFGFLGILLLFLIRNKRIPLPQGSDVPKVLTWASFGYLLPFCLQPVFISIYPSGLVAMSISLVPLLTIIVVIPMMRTVPRWNEWLGVLGGLFFTWLLFRSSERAGIVDARIGWIILVPLAYAIANTYLKSYLSHLSPLNLITWGLGLSSLINVPLAIFFEAGQNHWLMPIPLLSLLLLGLASTGLALFLFYGLIQSIGPVKAGLVGYLVPTVAVLIGLLDGEKIEWEQLAALLGIYAMVAVVSYKKSKT